MEYTNALVKYENNKIPRKYIEQLLLLLAPFAPYITEELWESIGNKFSIHNNSYPTYDEEKIKEDTVTMAVQVNGKLRSTVSVKKDEEKDVVLKLCKSEENVKNIAQKLKNDSRKYDNDIFS